MAVVRKLISLVVLLALIVPLICLSSPEAATADGINITNGGFETGDFTGWNVTIPPGGAAQVVTSFGTYLPEEGSFFAILTNGQQDIFTMVSQPFTVYSPGTVIQGWAFFKTVDYAPFSDESKVEITVTSGGRVIATLFQASVLSVGNYGGTPWTYWSYTFAAPGQYTIQAGVVNRGDSAVASYVGLDGVSFVSAGAPERRRPSSVPTPPATASIVVKNMNINPEQAYTGQPITISANMANDGDVVGGYVASLTINDKLEQTKLGTVEGHSAVPVNFTISRSQPGTYTIDIGGQKGTFTVLAAKTTSGPSVSSGAIVILIMFVLIVSTVAVLMLTFRRPA
jgi:hypothetical protein